MSRIIHWDCEFTFQDKDQLRHVVHWLLADEIEWEFAVSVCSDKGWPIYFLRIEAGIWANNLVRVSEFLSRIDDAAPTMHPDWKDASDCPECGQFRGHGHECTPEQLSEEGVR